jgi:hypothetical protein
MLTEVSRPPHRDGAVESLVQARVRVRLPSSYTAPRKRGQAREEGKEDEEDRASFASYGTGGKLMGGAEHLEGHNGRTPAAVAVAHINILLVFLLRAVVTPPHRESRISKFPLPLPPPASFFFRLKVCHPSSQRRLDRSDDEVEGKSGGLAMHRKADTVQVGERFVTIPSPSASSSAPC